MGGTPSFPSSPELQGLIVKYKRKPVLVFGSNPSAFLFCSEERTSPEFVQALLRSRQRGASRHSVVFRSSVFVLCSEEKTICKCSDLCYSKSNTLDVKEFRKMFRRTLCGRFCPQFTLFLSVTESL